MKTEDLARLLARGATAVPRHAAARGLQRAVLLSLPVTALLMVTLLGVRPDMADAARLPMFWVKLLAPLALALAAAAACTRLARPGVAVGWCWALLAAPVALLWLLGAAELSQAAAGERSDLLMGSTWRSCLVNIPLLSLPLLACAFVALRSLAPTQAALTGAAVGALAGGAAAAVYALHCPEMAAPFLAVWYVAGMAVPAAAGALLGPRLLKW